jgi:RNA polymerase sigma-70 factor (ECF subfamily)
VTSDAIDSAITEATARLGAHRGEGIAELRVQFVARIDDAVGDVPDDVRKLALVDLYLATALAAGDARAIALAEAELIPAARQAARKIDRNDAFVDEVVQSVREKVLVGPEPAISQYRGHGPLARWFRVVATRIAIDRKRRDRPGDADDDAIAQLPAPDDPELDAIWRTCADAYKRALAAAFAELDKRERLLLRQRYVDGLDINALGRVHRVHPSTAFRWLEKAEDALAAATRTKLRTSLALTDSQVASMERLVANHLQISLTGLLR